MRGARRRVTSGTTAAVLLLAGLVAVGPPAHAATEVAPSFATSAEPIVAYDKLFYRESGWTGADAHLSVPLGGDRTLWLYGDTGWGDIRDRQHTCPICIARNSVAIQQGKDPATASVRYHFGPTHRTGMPAGSPGAIFRPPGDPAPQESWYWPGDGVRTAAGLYVFLGHGIAAEGYEFGKHEGTWLAHVPNPDAPPDQWHLQAVTYQRLPFEVFQVPVDQHVSFGQSVLEVDGFLYLYGTRPGDWVFPLMTLARVRPAQIADLFAWEVYDFAAGAWRTIPRNAAPGSVAITGGPTVIGLYSVHHQPSLGRYVSTYTSTGFGNEIVARYAPSPTGPWSAAHVVHRCAEAGLDFRTTCYHGQAHPELARTADEVVLSYSTWDTSNGTYRDAGGQEQPKVGQLREASYAFPRFVRLRFPGAGVIEAESLVPTADATAPVVAQSGAPWSGGAHLWFQARRAGDYVEVPFDVPATGEYAVSVTQTKARDYGTTMATVDGQQITTAWLGSRLDFDGYAAAITTETVEHQPVYLAAGRHRLRLTVTGKNAASTGYFAGIDRVAVRRLDTRGPFRIEAETLLPPVAASAPVDVQLDGPWFWWSGGGQARVNATAAGQYAEFAFDVSTSGHYDLVIGQTEHGEYGINEIDVDGRRVGPAFDAHNPGIQVTPVDYGTIQLASGRHTLRVRVTGKAAAATGFRAGIDYVDVRPAYTVETGAMLEHPDWYEASAGTEVAVQRSGAWFAWSGGGQLWLRATQPGRYVDLQRIRAPVTGYYDLSAALTEAPDYGIATIAIDGQPIGQPFDAYHTAVTVTEVRYGRVRLSAGDHTLRLTVTGKNPASTGYLAGLDHLRLRPVSGVAAADRGPIGWDTYRRLDRFAELPTGVETLQFSSFDRSGGNADGSTYGCLRTTSAGCVIAEAEGPGEITSMWFTRLAATGDGDVSGTGRILVELDDRPVLDAPLSTVVRGALPAPTPFVPPLVGDHTRSSGGSYIKVPMPYRRGMRITTAQNPHFYSVVYRRFADATGVRTFDPADPAQDVIGRLRAAGTADPKPALPGARTDQRTVSVAPGATVALAQLTGPAEISALRLRLPQVVGPRYQPLITDDFREFKDSSSEFTARVDAANQGVRLTRRVNTYRLLQQRARVFVDGVEAGAWAPLPETTRGQFGDATLDLPAALTAGKSTIRIRTTAESTLFLGFQELGYRVDSRVGGQFVRTDSLDVGEQHATDEQAHAYRVLSQAAAGVLRAAYPMTGDPAAVAASNDVLGRARLRITFDGLTTVDAPLGEFFGSGLGEFDVRSLMTAMDPAGWYTSWWPMPLRASAVVELVNGSSQPLAGVDTSITWAPSFGPVAGLADGGRLGYFHASSRSAAVTSGRDWSLVDTPGRGKLVGVSHTMRGADDPLNFLNPSGYLEGDERIHADGSRSPQLHGTGTEDFYLGGWYFAAGPFSHAFSGEPGDLGAEFGCAFRCTGAYRLLLADAVPFAGGMRAGIEHGADNSIPATYASTAWWYGRAAPGLARSDVLDVGKADSEAAHGYSSSGPVTTLTSPFEGDDDTAVTDDLRGTSSAVTFRLAVPVDNGGVLLRRLSDQLRADPAGPDQAMAVHVDDVPVGVWRQPLHGNDRRWLEDSFPLPPDHTAGKGLITVRLVQVAGSAPWSAARYESYAVTAGR